MRMKDNELVNRIKLYIEEQIDRRGRMPTIRDIAEALDVGKSSVQRYLEYMVEQGILARGEYGYESIEQSRTEIIVCRRSFFMPKTSDNAEKRFALHFSTDLVKSSDKRFL